jgi:hypothetical protein
MAARNVRAAPRVPITHAIAEDFALRLTTLIVAMTASLASVGTASAQAAGNAPSAAPARDAACPPDVKGEPPTVGGGSSEPLSDKLAQSKGVICPPSGVDPEIHIAPPDGGRLKVIPPPGTPGGDPNVQPK